MNITLLHQKCCESCRSPQAQRHLEAAASAASTASASPLISVAAGGERLDLIAEWKDTAEGMGDIGIWDTADTEQWWPMFESEAVELPTVFPFCFSHFQRRGARSRIGVRGHPHTCHWATAKTLMVEAWETQRWEYDFRIFQVSCSCNLLASLLGFDVTAILRQWSRSPCAFSWPGALGL